MDAYVISVGFASYRLFYGILEKNQQRSDAEVCLSIIASAQSRSFLHSNAFDRVRMYKHMIISHCFALFPDVAQ